MNVMRRLILWLLLLLSVQAQGAFQFRDGWTKWMLRTTPEKAAAIVADVNGIVLWNYETSSLVYVPSADALKARASSVEISPVDDRILSPGGELDARSGIPSTVPPEGRQAPYAEGVVGAHLIQFIGPIVEQWKASVQNAGVVCAQYVPYDSLVCAGTPAQMRAVAALPVIQFVDEWHPFEKGWLGFGASLDPRVRIYVRYELTPSSESANARRELEAIAEWVGDIDLVVRVGEYEHLLQNRLLLYASAEGVSPPAIDSVWPRRAPPGERIVLTGDVRAGTTVAFNGVPSPHVELLDASRLAAVIPRETTGGPAEIVVELPDHRSQFIPGFEVGEKTSSDDFIGRDDLITADWVRFLEGQYMQTRWLMSDGTVRAVRRYETHVDYAAFVDERQRINVAGQTKTSILDARFNEIARGPDFLNGAFFVTMDRDGKYIVSTGRAIARYSHSGELLRSVDAQYVWQLDLAADHCTVAIPYKAVMMINLCTGEQLPSIDFKATNVRFLPDGTLLAVKENVVRRYSKDRALLAEVQFSDEELQDSNAAIGISADAKFAWLSRGHAYYRYDLRTNQVVGEVTPKRWASGQRAILVYGGWTAARGFAPPDPSIERVTRLPDGRIDIVGAGFIDGVTLTIGGQTIVIDEQTETVIRGHVAGGSPLNGVVVVTAPNGKTVSLAVTTPIPTLSEWGAILFVMLLLGLGIRAAGSAAPHRIG